MTAFSGDIDLLADTQALIALRRQDDALVERTHANDGFQDARSTHRMAEIALQTVDGYLVQASPEDGHRLHFVVEERGGAVGIDEGDILFFCPLHHLAQGIVASVACG